MRYNLNPIAGITRAGRDRAAMVRSTVSDAQAAGELGRSYDATMAARDLLQPHWPVAPNSVKAREAAKSAGVIAGMKADARTLGHMDKAITKREGEIADLQDSRWLDGTSRREVRKGTRAGNKDVKALTKARAQVEKDINAKNAAEAEYGN